MTALGVGGIFALLVIREVFAFVQKRRNGQQAAEPGSVDMQQVARQVDEMWRLHDKKDANGRPVWYVGRSLEDAVNNLATCVKKQEVLLAQIRDELKAFRHRAEQQ